MGGRWYGGRMFLTGEEMPGTLYSIADRSRRSTEGTTQVPNNVQLQTVFQMCNPPLPVVSLRRGREPGLGQNEYRGENGDVGGQS
jgi:hypothetical protein